MHSPIPVVDVIEAERHMHDPGSVLVDVRTPEEYESGHAPDAINIPLDTLSSRAKELQPFTQIYLICRAGGRSDAAARVLHAGGLTHVIDVNDGMMAWHGAGLPIL